MANRSYIYLKNGKDVRILTEGVYTIPYFWQLFWDEKDVRMPNILWKKFNILLPIEKFQKKATQNRSFLEKNAPHTLQLYDDFVRYILANVKAGDMLGFDVLEVADMDGLTIASRKLIKNIRAIQENQPQELDFSLTEKNVIWSAMGFPEASKESDSHVLEESAKFNLPTREGKNGRNSVSVFTDWKRFRMVFDENWSAMIENAGGMIEIFDYAINQTEYYKAGVYVSDKAFKEMQQFSEELEGRAKA